MRPKMFLVAVIISLIVAAPVTIALSKQNTKLQIEKANNHQLQLKIESDSKTLESKDQELKKKEQENTDLSQKLEAKAEAKAKLAAAQAATPSFPPGGVAEAASTSYSPQPTSNNSDGCEEWMIAAQVVDITNARILIARESGCNPNALNSSSGACGIPQALPCSKLGGTKDPVEQIKWMQSYVFGRYGSWANALSHSYKTGWY